MISKPDSKKIRKVAISNSIKGHFTSGLIPEARLQEWKERKKRKTFKFIVALQTYTVKHPHPQRHLFLLSLASGSYKTTEGNWS